MIVLLCLFLPFFLPSPCCVHKYTSAHTSPYTSEPNCTSTGRAEQYNKLCRPPSCAVLIGQFIPAGGCLSVQLGPALPGADQVHHMSWSKVVLILVIFHLQKKWKAYAKRSEMYGQVPRPRGRCYFVQRSIQASVHDVSMEVDHPGPVNKASSQQPEKPLFLLAWSCQWNVFAV